MRNEQVSNSVKTACIPALQANGLSQADLVRMAFAGDDVAGQFAADKAEEVEGELPKVGGSIQWGYSGVVACVLLQCNWVG